MNNFFYPIRNGSLPLLAAITIAFSGPASASASTIIVPNALATSEGNTFLSSPFNLTPFVGSTSDYYQQLYASGQFAGIGSPILIDSVSFREDAGNLQAFGPLTFSDITLRLSTTSRTTSSLSTTYADNVGPDVLTVCSGNVTLSSSGTTTASGTGVFDITIPFTTPYLYNPNNGNLLLEIINPNQTTGGGYWDFQNPGAGQVAAVWGLATTTTASSSGGGYVTQFGFTVVPEPQSLSLVALGSTVLAVSMRRGRGIREIGTD